MTFKKSGPDQAGLMAAMDIDIRTALAFSRAALKAAAGLSAQARAEVLTALDEEIAATGLDDSTASAAVAAVIGETRQRLAE